MKKKWLIAIFILLFVVSVGLNVFLLKEDKEQTYRNLDMYKTNLFAISETFDRSLHSQYKGVYGQNFIQSYQHAATALDLAGLLGVNSRMFKEHREVYYYLAHDMWSILFLLSESITDKEKLETANTVFQIYLKELKKVDFYKPNDVAQVRVKLMHEAEQRGLLGY